MSLQVGFTNRAIGGDPVSVGGEQERREGEGVFRRAVLENLPAEFSGSRAVRDDGRHLGVRGGTFGQRSSSV